MGHYGDGLLRYLTGAADNWMPREDYNPLSRLFAGFR